SQARDRAVAVVAPGLGATPLSVVEEVKGQPDPVGVRNEPVAVVVDVPVNGAQVIRNTDQVAAVVVVISRELEPALLLGVPHTQRGGSPFAGREVDAAPCAIGEMVE